MRTAFFDASGVLFNNGTAKLLTFLAERHPAKSREIAMHLSGPASWALRRGEISGDEFWATAGRTLARLLEMDVQPIRQLWVESFHVQPGMVELLEAMQAEGWRLGMIAETTAERAEHLESRYSLDRFFHWKFLSFQFGMDKRDGALFRLAYDHAGPFEQPPIMVEDEPRARDRAENAGFQAIMFESAAQLHGLFMDCRG